MVMRDGTGGAEPVLMSRNKDLSEIIEHSLRFYRDNFKKMLAVAAVLYLPAIILSLYFTADEQIQLHRFLSGVEPGAGRDAGQPVELASLLVDYLLVAAPLMLIVQPIASGACTYWINAKLFGRDMGVGDVYNEMWAMLWGFLSAVVIYQLAYTAGAMLFVVPGVLAALMFSLTQEVAVVEGIKGTKALARSYELVKADVLKTALLGSFLFMLSAMAVYAVRNGIELLLDTGPDAAGTTTGVFMSVNLGTSLVQLVLLPFINSAWLMLYYDLEKHHRKIQAEHAARKVYDALLGREKMDDSR